uniref:Replisome organizer n=1 Tax=uncultured bacterium Contig1770 TaxID=1393510 RepID=W0FLD0_9BACT|nr:replisome organizer [uncultured bacterium Contig1770]
MLPSKTYVVQHAWMVNDLGLSGARLSVYSIIYGFSQDGCSWFEGSQRYLAEWCGASTRTIRRALSDLKDMGLIEEREQVISGIVLKSYRVTAQSIAMHSVGGGQNVQGCGQNVQGVRTKCPGGADKMSTNIYRDNIEDNNKPPIVPLERTEVDGYDPIRDVIDHLNARANKSFKADTKATRGMVHARMEEGYGVDVIKRVIDLKVGQWSKSPKMRTFIRPSTLFSKTNFENYVNELGPISDYSKYDGVVDEVIGGGL